MGANSRSQRLERMLQTAVAGDQLGRPIEFKDKKEIHKKYTDAARYVNQTLGSTCASDETTLLTHSLQYFSGAQPAPHSAYTTHLGKLAELGTDTLKRQGFSRKMREMILAYHEGRDKEAPTDNGGCGFLPLILPLIPTHATADDLLDTLPLYVPKTHANADPLWTERYIRALYATLDDTSLYEALGRPNKSELARDRQLSIALSGNIEAIDTVNGSSSDLLPASIALYVASARDLRTMATLAVKTFSSADYDTLFFATGALVGASGAELPIPAMESLPPDLLELARKHSAGQPQTTRRATPLASSPAYALDEIKDALLRSPIDSHLLTTHIPELAIQANYESNQRRHCYPLLEHTLRTVQALPPRADLRLAGLLHDIAKPFVRGQGQRQATYHNHAKAGSRMSYEILSRLGAHEEEKQRICRLVGAHIINYTPSWSDKAVKRFKRKNLDILDDLWELVKADNCAQLPGRNNLTQLKRRIAEAE